MFLFTIACTLFLSSCHFYDNRIKAVNSSKQNILVGICHTNPNERDDSLSPFFLIKPGDEAEIKLLTKLNYDFLNVDSISVVVITPETEKSVTRDDGYVGYEKIFADKNFDYYHVAVPDKGRNDFLTVNYPRDGFKAAKSGVPPQEPDDQ